VRTDLKLNYGQLELIQSRIEAYYDAVVELDIPVIMPVLQNVQSRY